MMNSLKIKSKLHFLGDFFVTSPLAHYQQIGYTGNRSSVVICYALNFYEYLYFFPFVSLLQTYFRIFSITSFIDMIDENHHPQDLYIGTREVSASTEPPTVENIEFCAFHRGVLSNSTNYVFNCIGILYLQDICKE